jgi:hypothetical protein
VWVTHCTHHTSLSTKTLIMLLSWISQRTQDSYMLRQHTHSTTHSYASVSTHRDTHVHKYICRYANAHVCTHHATLRHEQSEKVLFRQQTHHGMAPVHEGACDVRSVTRHTQDGCAEGVGSDQQGRGQVPSRTRWWGVYSEDFIHPSAHEGLECFCFGFCFNASHSAS